MKFRLVTAIVLLVLAAGASVFCALYAEHCTGELQEVLQTALACAAAESDGWEAATDNVQQTWQRRREFLHILLPHVNLVELEWSIGALEEYLLQRDSTLYLESCVRALQCVDTVRHMERPTWGNIF